MLRATTACTFSTSQLPKVVRTWCVLYILTWKCASRHNGVHFFDISTSKSGPRPPVFYTFDLEMCFAPQRRALFRHLNFQKWSEAEVFCTFWLGNVLRATTACTFSTSQLPKVVRSWGVLDILTWKCASRHNGVHFFDISTSKSGPNLVCFGHFDLEMCFAPQRRALFRHLNFQKWSEPGVLWTFWLENVLRATTACNFSSLIWPAGSAPAALASLLFEPPEPQIIGKTQCFATFLPFRASASSFFWLFLFSDLLSSNLSLLSPSALLCFSSVHIVGSLTSKLPSMNHQFYRVFFMAKSSCSIWFHRAVRSLPKYSAEEAHVFFATLRSTWAFFGIWIFRSFLELGSEKSGKIWKLNKIDVFFSERSETSSGILEINYSVNINKSRFELQSSGTTLWSGQKGKF